MAPADLVPIGVFADTARLSVKALRHYDALRVLTPAWVDPRTGYRYYHPDQLHDALRVSLLRDLQVPLDEIAAHVAGGRTLTDLLVAARHRLVLDASRAERNLAIVDALLGDGPAGAPDAAAGAPVDEVSVEAHTALAASGPAHADTVGDDAVDLIARLVRGAERVGVDPSGLVTGVYPVTLRGTFPITCTIPTGERPVTISTVSTDDVTVTTVPAGRFLRVVHVGPYLTLPLAYQTLFARLADSGIPAHGPVRERYVDDPAVVAADELRTEVLHPAPAA